jgi:hypothetical protein
MVLEPSYVHFDPLQRTTSGIALSQIVQDLDFSSDVVQVKLFDYYARCSKFVDGLLLHAGMRQQLQYLAIDDLIISHMVGTHKLNTLGIHVALLLRSLPYLPSLKELNLVRILSCIHPPTPSDTVVRIESENFTHLTGDRLARIFDVIVGLVEVVKAIHPEHSFPAVCVKYWP